MTKFYFAEDGSYGDAANMVILEDPKFTPVMWQVLEEEHESTRADMAWHLDSHSNDTFQVFKPNHEGDPTCVVCFLTIDELKGE
jgi:hypothetical protein